MYITLKIFKKLYMFHVFKTVYVDYAPGVSTTTFNIITSGTSTSRYWNIRISQIPGGQSYTGNSYCCCDFSFVPWCKFVSNKT